jgi:hypothetical protein
MPANEMQQGRASNEPGCHDRAQVARLQQLKAAVERLRLPPLRARKLGAILNALEMQIEDGGDSPEVNRLLLDALRAGIHHQLDGRTARAALQAIDAYEQAESTRRRQIEADLPTPDTMSANEELDDLIQKGYDLLRARQTSSACRRWLEAWHRVKRLAGPAIDSVTAFDRAHPTLTESIFNWCQDLEMELGNAGLEDPAYDRERLSYAREFLERFPNESTIFHLNFSRAEAEALWRLGRRTEAETVYQALVDRLPDEAWSYIGWADQYWLDNGSPKEYATAEAILKRALVRVHLNDRVDLLERLAHLYQEWDKPEKRAATTARGGQRALGAATVPSSTPTLPAPAAQANGRSTSAQKRGRNEPCPCGSGLKFKRCCGR